MSDAELETRWRGLVPDAPYAEAAGRELLDRWREPHRRYHTVDHLAAVLVAIDVLAAGAPDPRAVRLAAWFHDAVYQPQQPDNEDRSARLAVRTLSELGVPAATVAEVRRLVLLTAAHRPEAGDGNGAALNDADLAVLGSARAGYDRYAALIRAEYAAVPDVAFVAGRAALLEQLLSAPSLYATREGRQRWEAAARVNLQRELDRLRDGTAGAAPRP